MKLDDVTEVRELYTEQAVNVLLKKGFKILRIYSRKVRYGENNDEVKPCYVLGIQEKNGGK